MRRALRRVGCGAILVGASACAPLGMLRATAPETTAVVAVPFAWSEAAAGYVDARPQELAVWWRRFDDPLLDALIDAAMLGAPDLRNAQARLRQARASRDLAVAGLFPSVDLALSANRSRSGGSATQTLYAAGFDAGWEPSIFGGQRDAVAGASADLDAAAASLDATRVSLIAEVALDYINLRAYQRRLAIARDNVASQAETLQIAEWRTEAGLATSLEVEQARANLELSRATLPGLRSGATEAEHRLAVLTGRPPAALRAQLAVAAPLPKPPEGIAIGIPADTLRQRPDVRAAELSLRAEIARTAQRRADRWPTLSLRGSLGWQAFSRAALGGGASAVRSLTGGLAATLFDGGAIRSRIEAQGAVQEQALIGYEKSILTALEDVENALAAYAAGRERVVARGKAATAAGNAALLAHSLYAAGSVDFQRVLDAERTRLSAEDGLASAEAEVLTAVVRLYKALGGGWNADAEQPPTDLTDKSS